MFIQFHLFMNYDISIPISPIRGFEVSLSSELGHHTQHLFQLILYNYIWPINYYYY